MREQSESFYPPLRKEPEMHKSPPTILKVLAFVIVAFFWFGAGVLVSDYSQRVVMPDVVGLPLDDAEKVAASLSIATDAVPAGDEAIADRSEWVVTSQGKPAGESISKGEEVTLSVTRKPAQSNVPESSGDATSISANENQADQRAGNAGQASSTAAPKAPTSISATYSGPVTAGTLIDRGAAGLSVTAAHPDGTSAATDAYTVANPGALEAGKISRFTITTPDGLSCTLDITSPATDFTAVPDVVGKPLDDAERELATAGFTTSHRSADGRTIIMRGNWTVTAQEPAAGASAPKGGKVELTATK